MIPLEKLFDRIDYRIDQGYQAAEQWYDEVTADTELAVPGSSFAFDYSVSRFEELAEAKSHIEDKADALLKFVATVAGAMVAAIVTISKAGLTTANFAWLCCPSFVMLGLAAICCLTIRRTSSWPSPFDPRATIDMTKSGFSEERLRAVSIAALHCSVVGARHVVLGLSLRLNAANEFTVLALLLLALTAFA